MSATYREGDPVWVDVQTATDLHGAPWTYEGTGVVHTAGDRTIVVQVGPGEDCIGMPVGRAEWALTPYRRPFCRYCSGLRLIVKGKAGDRVRWTCADCMGEQDT